MTEFLPPDEFAWWLFRVALWLAVYFIGAVTGLVLAGLGFIGLLLGGEYVVAGVRRRLRGARARDSRRAWRNMMRRPQGKYPPTP